jgi:ferrochelatase
MEFSWKKGSQMAKTVLIMGWEAKTMKEPNAVLLIGAGCPETQADLPAFLDGLVLRNILADGHREKIQEQFHAIGGACLYNAQVHDQAQALEQLLHARGRFLPVRAGFLYSFPSVFDSVKSLALDGNLNILAIPLFPFPSSQALAPYEQSISRATADVNVERREPVEILLARPFYDRPGFIQASASRIQETLQTFDPPANPAGTELVFVAPEPTVDGALLEEASRLTASRAEWTSYRLAGPGNGLLHLLDEISREGKRRVLLSPLGYPTDSLDVLGDLDGVARKKAEALGLAMVRAKTVGSHPSFIATLSSLAEETLP